MEYQSSSWLKEIKNYLVIITIALCLTSCSSTKLAYWNADKGILWWVDDYISMTFDQEKQLKQDIETVLDWHCREELPRYSEWLTELKQDVRLGQMQSNRLIYHQEQLLSFISALVEQTKPAIKRLLISLSDEQVKELEDNMAKNQLELEDEYLADDPEQIKKARTERAKKRIKSWLGSLNDSQNQIIEHWSSNRGRQTQIWLEGRRIWQKELLKILTQRKEDGFDEAIDSLIDNYDDFRGPEYQKMMAETQVSMVEMLTALLGESDQQQLDFMVRKATNLRDDFNDLACTVDEPLPKG